MIVGDRWWYECCRLYLLKFDEPIAECGKCGRIPKRLDDDTIVNVLRRD